MSEDAPAPQPRPTFETLVSRAMKLRCPRCGIGQLFTGWFTMPERCSECRFKYERASGYFLGSTYINYGLTAVSLTAIYFALHFGMGWSNRQLAAPLAVFCVLVPMLFFRHARALWLALDCHFDASVLASDD
ncbi:MAG: DUF983 domain-containing protein [Planctomycetaceae bacterium]|nr:DUF983 domain-containing protein [Planctomycetaceae bacterium]